MSAWILIAIAAYLLFAINGVGDKFLLTRAVRDPGVYAFYNGIPNFIVLLLFPFGLRMLSPDNLIIALVAGMVFIFGLYYLYSAEQEASVSRVLPIEGGLVPVFTLSIVLFTGIERFSSNQIFAFVFLVSGAILISLKKDKKGWQPKALWHGAIAAMFFAISFVLTKYIYTQTNFISGLIWTRIGAGIAALAFFAMPETRRGIALAPHKTGHQKKVVFYCLAACGALAGFLQNYAISLGSVVIVNALQGLQYVFLLIMGVILSMNYPNIIKEDVRGKILVQKIAAIILITAGLVFLKI